jgi:hypothetical protein
MAATPKKTESAAQRSGRMGVVLLVVALPALGRCKHGFGRRAAAAKPGP